MCLGTNFFAKLTHFWYLAPYAKIYLIGHIDFGEYDLIIPTGVPRDICPFLVNDQIRGWGMQP